MRSRQRHSVEIVCAKSQDQPSTSVFEAAFPERKVATVWLSRQGCQGRDAQLDRLIMLIHNEFTAGKLAGDVLRLDRTIGCILATHRE